MPAVHPLRTILDAAAAGRFPPADGAVEVLEPPPGPSDAVVAFTAHAVVAAGIDAELVKERLDGEDLGAPMGAPFLLWLGEQLGTPPGSLDVVLVADPIPAAPGLQLLREVPDHPRVHRSLTYRREVRVWRHTPSGGLVIAGRGLAGRLEVSVELAPEVRGKGGGISLAAVARAVGEGQEPVYAQVAPGNVASLRAFLSAGFRPIGSEVLFLRGT